MTNVAVGVEVVLPTPEAPVNAVGLEQEVVEVVPYCLSSEYGYQATRARYGIELTMLSLLTGFSVGKTTIGQLAENPLRMRSLVLESSGEPDPFLSLVPRRYGSSEVLTAAADCLLARAASALLPLAGFEYDAARLYAKALRRLQEAIRDARVASGSDVLCAVQLLTLHELLDTSRSEAWSHHVSGSVRIMKHRSPKPFQNEYEKALFQNHVGAVVSEALHSNSHCYLAEPSWTSLYESLIEKSDDLGERHELVINARKLIFPLPGLWHDISMALRSSDATEREVVSELESRCRGLQAAYFGWLESYREHCIVKALSMPTEQEIHIRREVLGQALESLLIVDLLLATVSISLSMTEHEIEALASRIMELQKQPGPRHSWLFTGQEIGVAQVAIATKGLFASDLSDLTPQEKAMERRKRYTVWSGLLRGC
ncbi:putative fungal transcription factor [Septoria linicola]|nr:putative fungal transcription factor [Septoria linicola]